MDELKTRTAVPTAFKGVQFRSRLEARWATFFQSLGWRWTYEPFDLEGYVPDFVLHFSTPLLVEVKPACALDELYAFTEKIDQTSWPHEALLVGVTPFFESLEDLWGGMREAGHLGLLRNDDGDGDGGGYWNEANFVFCEAGQHIGLCSAEQSYHCRVCGTHNGSENAIHGDQAARCQAAWGYAQNSTQWTPSASTGRPWPAYRSLPKAPWVS